MAEPLRPKESSMAGQLQQPNALLTVDKNDGPVPLPLPDQVEHHCTDISWLVLFLLAAAGVVGLSVYVYENADLSKFTNEFDYLGRMCGRDTCENGFTCGNYLYYCAWRDGSVDYSHPICVSECPSSNLTFNSCFDKTTGDMQPLPDYPTTQFNTKCLGTKHGHDQIRARFEPVKDARSFAGRLLEIAGSIERSKWTFAVTFLVVTLAGFAYLYFMKAFAVFVIYMSMLLLIVVPTAAGFWELWNVQSRGFMTTLETLEGRDHLRFSLGMLAIGLGVGYAYTSMEKGFMTAAGVIDASCECIFEVPSVLLQPFTMLILKVLAGFYFIAVCGGLASTGTMVLFVDSDGQHRNVEYSSGQICGMLFLTFMMLWLFMLLHNFAQYTLTYMTQRWYFTPYVDDSKTVSGGCCLLLFDAIYNCCRYHFGSIALASFLKTVLAVPALILGLRTYFPCCSTNDEDEVGNEGEPKQYSSVYKLTAFLRKSAFMDMSITSANYRTAAPRGLDVLDNLDSALTILDGTQLVFKLGCVGCMSCIGAVTGAILLRQDVYTDPQSESYVPAPMIVTLCHAAVGAIQGITFMNVFDVVGDTILYCVALEESRYAASCAKKDATRVPNIRSYCLGWLAPSGQIQDEESQLRSVQYAPNRLLEVLQEADGDL
eukprot:TRINITY_DN27294_c0_g1_i1.p1 TRINITY_DN27294_c0_g1~~TRINITY_DN27294_c0_g1_i1.p1  ORF type:complete len:656 (+),score=93.35 TRINITY_DN27294_c0_g1_i1:75-2042(+)